LSAIPGLSPLIDPRRRVGALRLRLRADRGRPSRSYGEVWQALTASYDACAPQLLLSVEDQDPESDLLEQSPLPNVWVEYPAASLERAAGLELARALRSRGFRLLAKGAPSKSALGVLLGLFEACVVSPQDALHAHAAFAALSADQSVDQSVDGRGFPFICADVDSTAQLQRSFALGAQATVGWPFVLSPGLAGSILRNREAQRVIQALALIDERAACARLAALIGQSPAMLRDFLREAGSDAPQGVRADVFCELFEWRGPRWLRHWLLARLVRCACPNDNLHPIIAASIWRARFLRALYGETAQDPINDDVTSLGLVSLLGRLFAAPFAELLASLRVGPRIWQALVDHRGPYRPLLELLDSIEQGPRADLPDWLARTGRPLQSCNLALLASVGSAFSESSIRGGVKTLSA
jgi:c-di-GMP phosphodiesterase